MDQSKSVYLTKAVHHYGTLFTFPGYWILMVLLLVTSLGGSIVAFTIIHPNLNGVQVGLVFALQVLFIPMTIVDIISRETITKVDVIFDLRRSTSLSLVTCMVWIVTMMTGGVLQVFLDSPLLYYATVFSVCSTVAIRFLVVNTVTQLSHTKRLLSTINQPIVLLISNAFFWNHWSTQILGAVLISSIVLVSVTQLFIHIVNKQGEAVVGIGAIPLFRGFLANWLEGFTYPLEDYFEKLGTNADVSINLLAFKGKNKIKAIMVIPNIHPGPFRNLGSSDLPGMIQRSLEAKFTTITAVPHGLSGHELDLTSQSQCDRVVEEILKTDLSSFSTHASKLVRIDTGLAKATCQFFGEIALVTATCAPKSMEDISLEIGEEIMRKGERLGAKQVAIIDAHNSIGGAGAVPILSEEEEQELTHAAEMALKNALKEERQHFLIGVAKVIPSEFTPSQGMGPSGIVALAVIVGGQKTLYVTIDGNNMVSGLREKIIQALSDRFDECEVLTTDTHVVNGLGIVARGYYPLGETIDHKQLIVYIRAVALKALDNVEEAEISFTRVYVNNVRIIGEEKLASLTMLIDLTFKRMKWIAPIIYIPAVIAAILFFIFIR